MKSLKPLFFLIGMVMVPVDYPWMLRKLRQNQNDIGRS